MFLKIVLYTSVVFFFSLLNKCSSELHAPCYLCEFHHMQELNNAKKRISSRETMQADAPVHTSIQEHKPKPKVTYILLFFSFPKFKLVCLVL